MKICDGISTRAATYTFTVTDDLLTEMLHVLFGVAVKNCNVSS